MRAGSNTPPPPSPPLLNGAHWVAQGAQGYALLSVWCDPWYWLKHWIISYDVPWIIVFLPPPVPWLQFCDSAGAQEGRVFETLFQVRCTVVVPLSTDGDVLRIRVTIFTSGRRDRDGQNRLLYVAVADSMGWTFVEEEPSIIIIISMIIVVIVTAMKTIWRIWSTRRRSVWVRVQNT